MEAAERKHRKHKKKRHGRSKSRDKRDKKHKRKGKGKKSKSRSRSKVREKDASNPDGGRGDGDERKSRRSRSRTRAKGRSEKKDGEGQKDSSRSGDSDSDSGHSAEDDGASTSGASSPSKTPSPRGGRGKERGRSQGPGRRARPKKASKSPGGKKSVPLEPHEWSREELMDRMGYVGVFNMNKETGIGELDVSGKRLLPADLEVVIEVLKRYTEIQTVTMKRCAISDDMFEKLMEGLTKARHIKRLDLSLNLLTVRSFTLLREHFSSLERRLEVMDLRLNSMTERDGVNLYRSFPYLQLLNGMKLCDVRDDKSKSVLDFSGIMMGRAEMAIMCDLLLECPHIEAIDVSRNTLDTYCLKYLADRLIYKTHVHKVNVSQNPIFKPKDNMLGLEMLLEVCQQTTHMWDVVLEGIEVPEELQKALTTSLMVNRSMRRNTFDTYFYNDIAGKVRAAAGPPREDPNADWKPQLDIDRRFCVRYKVPETTIEVEDGEIKIVRALDEVTLKIQERKRRGAAAARARAEAK